MIYSVAEKCLLYERMETKMSLDKKLDRSIKLVALLVLLEVLCGVSCYLFGVIRAILTFYRFIPASA